MSFYFFDPHAKERFRTKRNRSFIICIFVLSGMLTPGSIPRR